jgi:hypothetical protein
MMIFECLLWSNYSQLLNQQSEQILRDAANGRSILIAVIHVLEAMYKSDAKCAGPLADRTTTTDAISDDVRPENSQI